MRPDICTIAETWEGGGVGGGGVVLARSAAVSGLDFRAFRPRPRIDGEIREIRIRPSAGYATSPQMLAP